MTQIQQTSILDKQKINIEKRNKLKKKAVIIAGVLSLSLFSKSIFADIIIGEKTNKNTEIKNILTTTDQRQIGDITLNYTDENVTSISTPNRTITLNYIDNEISSYTDGTYTWTINKTDGKITSIEVT